jgi:Isochorismatase family
MIVRYSLAGSNGKATAEDIMDAAIKPRSGEWYRQPGPDKVMGSTLEPTLRQADIKAVIIYGSSFQGATVGTASAAAQRDGKVIVPVDCSASQDVYHEQYAAFHLAKGGPAGVTSNVMMTCSTMIRFSWHVARPPDQGSVHWRLKFSVTGARQLGSLPSGDMHRHVRRRFRREHTMYLRCGASQSEKYL